MGRFGKKRIGLLTPAGNTTMEDDFARWMPASVKLHVNRLYTGSPGNPNTPQGLLTGLQEMGDSLEEPARWLAAAMVDVNGCDLSQRARLRPGDHAEDFHGCWKRKDGGRRRGGRGRPE